MTRDKSEWLLKRAHGKVLCGSEHLPVSHTCNSASLLHPKKGEQCGSDNTEEAMISFKRMVKSSESIVRNAWWTSAATVSVCISRKRSNHSRGSKDLLSALERGYPVVTEPLQLVGFKQGSGKTVCAFQITLDQEWRMHLLEARL